MKSTTSHEDQFNPAEEEAWRELERRQIAPVAAHDDHSEDALEMVPQQPVSGADGLPDTGLLARLRIHAEDKRNTAFSRSTMQEVIQVLERGAAQPQPYGNARHLADETRVGILADSSYAEGMKVGYQMGTFGDGARYQKAQARLHAQLREARAEIKEQPSGNAGELPKVGLPPRPAPEAPANTVGIGWHAYTAIQMLSYGRTCADAQREADRAALAAQASGQDREDAERYRWLRRTGVNMDFAAASLMWKHTDALDAAIDAARKAKGGV